MLLACACTLFWCCNITCSVVGYRRLVCRAVVPMMREVVMIETLMGMSFQHPALFLILTVVLLQQRLLSASLCHRHLLHSAAFRPMTLWNRVPHQNVVLRQLHMMMLGPPPSYLLVPPVARHCYDLYLVMCCRISLYVYLCEFAGLCLIVFFLTVKLLPLPLFMCLVNIWTAYPHWFSSGTNRGRKLRGLPSRVTPTMATLK